MDAPEIARSLEKLVTSLRDLLSDTNRDSLRQSAGLAGEPRRHAGRSRGAGRSARWPSCRRWSPTCAPAPPGCRRCWRDWIARRRRRAAGGDGRRAAHGDRRGRHQARGVAPQGRAIRPRADRARTARASTSSSRTGCRRSRAWSRTRPCLVNELNGAVRDMRQDPARFFLGDRAGQGVKLRMTHRLARRAGCAAAGGWRWRRGPCWRSAGCVPSLPGPGPGAAHLPRHAQIHLRRGSAAGELVPGGGRADRRADAGHQPDRGGHQRHQRRLRGAGLLGRPGARPWCSR